MKREILCMPCANSLHGKLGSYAGEGHKFVSGKIHADLVGVVCDHCMTNLSPGTDCEALSIWSDRNPYFEWEQEYLTEEKMRDIAAKVIKIIKDSLFKDDEIKDGIPENAIIVEGVMNKFGFHKERLEAHRAEVIKILREMPETFQKDKGGGWSFLNLATDKNGKQWGEHSNVDELILLAIGLGLARFLLPRKDWSALPGMPYIVFDL